MQHFRPYRPLSRSARDTTLRVALGLVLAWALPATGSSAVGIAAPGGEPLLAAAESAVVTALGRVEQPTQIDRHGWAAWLRVEDVLAGAVGEQSRIRIAWEELSRGRPVRRCPPP